MTFTGKPRDHHIYDHAHESPKVMYVPLVVLAMFAVSVGWTAPGGLSVTNLLEQSRPAGAIGSCVLLADLHYPDEHDSHAPGIHLAATAVASATALAGFFLATLFYGLRKLDADEVRRQFRPIYGFLVGKWWFDELYDFLFIRPTHFVARLISKFDKNVIDVAIDKLAVGTKALARTDDLIDRTFVDGLVNIVGNWTYAVGRSLRAVQTGRIRQYVMLIVVGVVALSFVMQWAFAGTR
jgi:NADH:ubiquinone oxidoreductase subunit 5 (subunit L)/multisubunit Na+/H+ antiporter MnhA subunit